MCGETLMVSDTHRAIEAVWRIESPKVIAVLARIVHDLALAEDAAQDALLAALEQWPASGVPDSPAPGSCFPYVTACSSHWSSPRCRAA